MAKKIEKKLKLQILAGKANPAPPIGPALGQAGINIGEFVTRFNDATKEMGKDIIPVEISVYEDRSFDFVLKTSPASRLLLKALGKDKGSGKNLVSKVGKATKKQLIDIATKKLPDLNTNDPEQGAKIIAGTARSMGIETDI
ncbi:MAG: 50S ribosomal protein L11 [Candidatus Pacebacteria bacterium]|jgi:large subunit ribosomal protein L11|nr:50S ribosomal protein L11 [Candidatus Paceibacterota bacterium]|tara:strand:- start:23153 stop:23578 length:426 start_codon:yes stop_codon:yes gene_type:complete